MNTDAKIKVAIQGIEGSYSHLTSEKFFSNSESEIELVSKRRFADVIKAVENNEADYALLPIENTTSGGINEVYDLLLKTNLAIIGEEVFHVQHCLVGIDRIPLDQITKIYAHHQAAVQCSRFLETLPNCKIEYFDDTAMSVQKIKREGNKNFAAISSEQAAQLFELPILKRDIANQSENYTRFIIASRHPVKVDSKIKCKTSLVLATEHKPGSLVRALSILDKFNCNMTKLESRPIIGNPWDEMFYLDFEGNIENEIVKEMLSELEKNTNFLKILGCYASKTFRKSSI